MHNSFGKILLESFSIMSFTITCASFSSSSAISNDTIPSSGFHLSETSTESSVSFNDKYIISCNLTRRGAERWFIINFSCPAPKSTSKLLNTVLSAPAHTIIRCLLSPTAVIIELEFKKHCFTSLYCKFVVS